MTLQKGAKLGLYEIQQWIGAGGWAKSTCARYTIETQRRDQNHSRRSGRANRKSRAFVVMPINGERKPQPYSPSPTQNFEGLVSPDGKWMAYMSTESETLEIYVLSRA